MTEGTSKRRVLKTDQKEKIVLQFVGDISLNGLFCDPQYQLELSKNMKKLANELGDSDSRVGNWESPLWGDGGVNMLKEPRLCTTENAAMYSSFLS